MIINFHLDFDDGLIFIVLILFLEPRWFRPLGTMNGWLRWFGSISAAVPQIISQIISHDHSLFSLGPRLVVELVLQWGEADGSWEPAAIVDRTSSACGETTGGPGQLWRTWVKFSRSTYYLYLCGNQYMKCLYMCLLS